MVFVVSALYCTECVRWCHPEFSHHFSRLSVWISITLSGVINPSILP